MELKKRAKILKFKRDCFPWTCFSFHLQHNVTHIIFILFVLLRGGPLLAQHEKPAVPLEAELSDFPGKAEKTLQKLENSGYPFAAVSLKAASPETGDMTPVLVIDSGLFVTFDSIIVKGTVRLSRDFLYPYLGLRNGMPYCEEIIRKVNGRLEELPYATVAGKADVAFVKDKACLYVYLNKKNTNLFDGYIGLVPVDEEKGRTTVNGELTLSLQNIFRLGESIGLHWYSSSLYSQHLDLSASFPYLFRTRFGINGSFVLDKRDTSYLNLNFHAGLPYAFVSNSYIEPCFDHTGSSVLDAGLVRFEDDSSFIDYRKTLFGLRFRHRRLDYLFNPRKGIDISASLSAGRRKIIKNSQIDDIFYQNIPLQKTSYCIMGSVQGYLPIGRRWTVAARLKGGSLLSGPHCRNELTDIGGPGNIRGFKANDISASTFLLYSAELRYLFGKKSYVCLFFDGGTYEQQLSGRYMQDSPFGFGGGIHLAVKSGLFYLEYALGRQQKSPLSFKRGLIHFGIQVTF